MLDGPKVSGSLARVFHAAGRMHRPSGVGLTVERMLIELGHGPEHDRRSGPKRCSVELRRSPVGGAAAAADLADVHAARAVVTALAMPAATGP